MSDTLLSAFASGDMETVANMLRTSNGAVVHSMSAEPCGHCPEPVAHLILLGSTVFFWSNVFAAHGQDPNGLDVLAHNSITEAVDTFEQMREAMRETESMLGSPLMRAVAAIVGGQPGSDVV